MMVFKHVLLGILFEFLYFILSKLNLIMGKGDKKTKRGKINRGTFGTRRPRIKKRRSTESKIDINKKATVK